MEITKGVHLHVIQSDKFKDIGISIRFLSPLDEKTVTFRSLLAVMMCDRCNAYPSKKEMSDKQDNLYGITLQAQTVGYGKAHVLEVRSKMMDPIYVKEQKHLFHEILMYLKEVITGPYVCEESLDEAKKLLESKMLRMRDNPSHYASNEGFKRGGKGTALAISSLGELEILKSCTLEDVKKQLQHILTEDRIDILVCGRCEEREIESSVREVFSWLPRDAQYETHYQLSSLPKEAERESRSITQSSVFMLWNTHCDMLDDNYYALRLGNAIFGQYPSSLLFQEVREKHSLCYSIQANLISFDGAMAVSTGVEQDDEEKAISLIHDQFHRICEGDFDDELLQTTKSLMINSLIATKDSMSSLMALDYQNAVLGYEQSIDDRIKRIQKVNKQDVQRVFKACDHLFTFIVSKEANDEENHK